MLNYYYDLHNENILPSNARFVDPYDHTIFRPIPNQTLSQFIKQIAQSREDKNQAPFLETELKQLVVASLYESTPKADIQKYFVKCVAMANLSQIVSVSKTIASQLIHRNTTPSLKIREARAAKCLNSCVFHKTNSTWSKAATNAVVAIVGLQDLAEPKTEKSLGTCGMCGGCSLQEKIKFPIISILAGLLPERLDLLFTAYREKAFQKCWIVQEALENPVTKTLLKKKLLAGNANGLVQLEKHITNQMKKSREPSKKSLAA